VKWFKHISTSIDDPFINLLRYEFGFGIGYYLFFGIIEIYSREFQPEISYFLEVNSQFICDKLGIKRKKNLEKFLNFMNKSRKWKVKKDGENYSIWIPKFFELLTNRL